MSSFPPATPDDQVPRADGRERFGAFGVGGARWSLVEHPDDALAQRVIRAAVDNGVRLIDTAAAYCPGVPGTDRHNERLIGRSLNGPWTDRPRPLVATKGGHGRRENGEFFIDGRPETLRRHCEESLEALGVDRLDLYQLHWPDPEVAFETSVETLAELRRERLVAEVGLCNVSTAQVERARAIVPIATVQQRFSLVDQGEAELVDYCDRHAITLLAYSPLGGPGGMTSDGPLGERLAVIAARHAASVHEIALAWLRHRSAAVVPIVGAGRPASVISARRSTFIHLTADEVSAITHTVPPATPEEEEAAGQR